MATLEIEGKKVEVDDAFLNLTPEQQNATVEEIAKSIQAKPQDEESAASKDLRSELSGLSTGFGKESDGALRNVDSFMRGAADTLSFGLADELAAAGAAATGIGGKFGDYSANLRAERAKQAQRDDIDPVASTTGRVAGALTGGVGLAKMGAPLMSAPAADAGLLARMGQGAASGALYGGAYGFGSGEGTADRLAEGAKMAGTSAVFGAAIPAVAAGVQAAASPVVDAIKGRVNPGAFADAKIAERLQSAGMTPEQAAAKAAKVPGLSLADVGGKPAQNLLKTATNVPGPAQQSVYTKLVTRQMQQGDRIKNAVKSTFADPDGYLAAKDKIAADAAELARPLYEEAGKTPIPFTRSLQDIIETPAGKEALNRAERLAANEGVPFQQFFANVADDGSATIRRVPDARGWDYIKRGLDDMIDGTKNAGTFGKMNNEGRVLTALKNRMLDELDKANPAYAAARKVWSGQAGLDDALEAGREAMTKSPEEISRLVSKMSAAEKESFKIGVADWIRKQVDSAGFTQNSLLRFFSNRGQLKNLRAAFDNDAQFKSFRDQIFAEARRRSTYNVVTGNSSTARQLADMAEAGGLNQTVDAVRNVATQGVVPATLNYIGSRLKMLGGFTPEVADEVAKKLMTTNPDTVREITRSLMQIEAQKISADQKRQLVYRVITPLISGSAVEANQQVAR